MRIVVAIGSGFAAALLAPVLCRLAGRVTGPLLAMLPLALCVYFATAVADGAAFPVRTVQPWAPAMGVDLSFVLDGLSVLFSLMITGIGTLVLIYAGGYLPHATPEDRRTAGRFYAFVLCFMASMLGLVLADNVIALYLFWEGTSITSFLLIGINHDKPTARAAAWQALLVTGAGGLALLGGLVMLGQAAGSFEISQIVQRAGAIHASGMYLPALILVLAGAFTKSAQFPFHFWLPSAMEAPTPVSAYLHSATMVKGGVYLLARLTPALAGTPAWGWGVIPAGAVTALIGGYLAMHTSDLKRVLAYSTVSVLGALVLLLGIGTEGAVKGAVVLLLAHAMYKGALFMVVGAIDHETGTRELDRLGGLWRFMPITAVAAMLAAVSMAGLWPMLNFIAKELLLEAVWTWTSAGRIVLALVAVLAGAMFFIVAWIVGVRPFFGERPAGLEEQHIHEPPPTLWIGPALLAAGGLVFGLFPRLIDNIASPAASAIRAEPVEVHLALWHGVGPALILSVASIALGAALYYGWVRYRRTNPLLERVLGWGPNRWYRDIVAGFNAVAVVQTRMLQSGHLRHYLLITLSAVVLMVAIPLFWRVDFLRRPASPVGMRFYEVALAMLIVFAAFAAVRARSRVAAITALGVVGYAVGLIFVLFGAPDLAMTQFLVETLVVILFVLVFNILPPPQKSRSSILRRARDATLAVAGGAVFTALVVMANSHPLDRRISDYFTENSLPGGHGRNIVNVILVDFRGLDTLGEITVLAVAGMGVYALLKLRPTGVRHDPRPPKRPGTTSKNLADISDEAEEVQLELASDDDTDVAEAARPAGGERA